MHNHTHFCERRHGQLEECEGKPIPMSSHWLCGARSLPWIGLPASVVWGGAAYCSRD